MSLPYLVGIEELTNGLPNLVSKRLVPLAGSLLAAAVLILLVTSTVVRLEQVDERQIMGVGLLCWMCFAMASLVENVVSRNRQDAAGIMVGMALRTGGVAAAAFLIGAVKEREVARELVLILASYYLVALFVDTGLWLRQIRRNEISQVNDLA